MILDRRSRAHTRCNIACSRLCRPPALPCDRLALRRAGQASGRSKSYKQFNAIGIINMASRLFKRSMRAGSLIVILADAQPPPKVKCLACISATVRMGCADHLPRQGGMSVGCLETVHSPTFPRTPGWWRRAGFVSGNEFTSHSGASQHPVRQRKAGPALRGDAAASGRAASSADRHIPAKRQPAATSAWTQALVMSRSSLPSPFWLQNLSYSQSQVSCTALVTVTDSGVRRAGKSQASKRWH